MSDAFFTIVLNLYHICIKIYFILEQPTLVYAVFLSKCKYFNVNLYIFIDTLLVPDKLLPASLLIFEFINIEYIYKYTYFKSIWFKYH